MKERLPSIIFKNFILPIDYYVSKESEPPFLVYKGDGSYNFSADDKVFNKVYEYTIEYYFRVKDEEIEEKIESCLDEHDIIWSKSRDNFIEDDEIFVIYYDI